MYMNDLSNNDLSNNDLSNNDLSKSIFNTYTTDCSGYLIYPSIYKQRYDDISSENKNYYILETMNMIDLNIWKQCFKIDNEKNITIQHKYFSKFLLELKKCLDGPMYLTGKSFSKHKTNTGSFFNYYLQYLANNVFKHPSITIPFKNNKFIQKTIANIINDIIDNLYDKQQLDDMLMENFFKGGSFVLDEENVLQFKVFIKPPEISFPNYFTIDIPVTEWYINIRLHHFSNEL